MKKSGVFALLSANSASVCRTNISPCAGCCVAYSRNFPSSSTTTRRPDPPDSQITRVADSNKAVISEAEGSVPFSAVSNRFWLSCINEAEGIVPLEKVSPRTNPRRRPSESGARSPEISTGQKPESELFPLPFVCINRSCSVGSPRSNKSKACCVVEASGSPSSFAAKSANADFPDP